MTVFHRNVVVIGAGVAGLASAVALAKDGAAVTLLERRPFVGGRAYSYPHPALNETIDSQHVILGCCTNFLDLISQSGAADSIRWYDELNFLEPQVPHNRRGRIAPTAGLSTPPPTPNLGPIRSSIHPSRLPAPFHNSLSFLRAPMLTLRDKAGIASGLARFLRGYPQDDTESFAVWLKRTRQTDRAIRHFWEPVIVGALNDTFEHCSTKYAGKVFHESFLRSREGGRLGIPAAPLSEFFAPIAAHARTLGVDLQLNSPADTIIPTVDGHWQVTSHGREIFADAIILATDFRQTQRILNTLAISTGNSGAISPNNFDNFVAAPITTIHLWYDREITSLDHAVLLDTRIQWLFHKSRIRRLDPARGSYLELVISASWPEIVLPREQILAAAIAEAEVFFPRIREATLVKSAVLKEVRATFSVPPGLDAHRPPQTTAHRNLYVAGDWTATEWPSTMEGAIRGGRLAAGELTGNRTLYLAPELPAAGLMPLVTRA